MDDFGVARLQKTVTRSAASLPSLIIWALAPKEEGMAFAVAGCRGARAGGCSACAGLVKMRSWGVLALARRGRARPSPASGRLRPRVACPGHFDVFAVSARERDRLGGAAAFTVVLLVAALLPFARPVARFLRRSP